MYAVYRVDFDKASSVPQLIWPMINLSLLYPNLVNYGIVIGFPVELLLVLPVGICGEAHRAARGEWV